MQSSVTHTMNVRNLLNLERRKNDGMEERIEEVCNGNKTETNYSENISYLPIREWHLIMANRLHGKIRQGVTIPVMMTMMFRATRIRVAFIRREPN